MSLPEERSLFLIFYKIVLFFVVNEEFVFASTEDYYYESSDYQTFDQYENLDYTACDFTFRSKDNKTGLVYSPGYPSTYKPHLTCRYIFDGEFNEKVQISFDEFDLSYPMENPHNPLHCDEDVDTLTVFIELEGKMAHLGNYCGRKIPHDLMSSEKKMQMIFQSFKKSNRKGFMARYTFITDYGMRNGQQKDNSCDFTFKSSTNVVGSFSSPNFPGLYPRNIECNYHFYSKYQTLHIHFQTLDVDGVFPGCTEDTESDYIFYDNKRFCGDKVEFMENITKKSNYFKIKFVTNDVYDAMGFLASYRFENLQDGTYIASEDHISCSTSQVVFSLLLNLIVFTYHTKFIFKF